MSKLTSREIDHLMEYYIGIDGGYLGDFYDRKVLKEFYQIDCDLDIHPNYEYPGKIREEFRAILEIQHPQVQARILYGVLKRFGVTDRDAPHTRTAELRKKFIAHMKRLASHSGMVDIKPPQFTSDTVRRTLADADHLIRTRGTPHAVDRIHTAVHGHLQYICDSERIKYKTDDGVTVLFKLIRHKHPAFSFGTPRNQHIEKVLNSLANILDALNPIRNRSSSAHPTPSLLSNTEATLAANAGLSIIQYLDAKLTDYKKFTEIPF